MHSYPIESHNKFSAVLAKKQLQDLNDINQVVHMHNIVVVLYDVKILYGHTKGSNFESHKLINHVSFLMDLANEDHRAYFCIKQADGKYKLKHDKRNHVTRLVTGEFCLYTKEPLTENEFATIYEKIEKISHTLEPNVHILLSSMAVLLNTGMIINLAIFIQGGDAPILRTFVKSTCTPSDLKYFKTDDVFWDCFKFNGIDRNAGYPTDFVFVDNTTIIDVGSLFIIQTQGGAKYTQCVDICMDHVYARSKRSLEHRLLCNDLANVYFPNQIDHILTAAGMSPLLHASA